MVDGEILRLYALRTGLGMKYLSKDEMISVALKQLRPLFPDVIFKGGTALNRVYLSQIGVNRFSEDIGLDYIGTDSPADRIPRITSNMQNLPGFEVAAPRIMNWTVRYDCGYTLDNGERDRIRVEFYMKDQITAKSEDMLVKSSFIDAYPTLFRTYTLEALMAKKLVALHNRTEGKDIYDMFYALDLPFNRGVFDEALRSSQTDNGLSADTFYDSLQAKLQNARKNSFYLGNCTNHFIPQKLRPNWKIFIDTLAMKIDRLLSERRSV